VNANVVDILSLHDFIEEGIACPASWRASGHTTSEEGSEKKSHGLSIHSQQMSAIGR